MEKAAYPDIQHTFIPQCTGLTQQVDMPHPLTSGQLG